MESAAQMPIVAKQVKGGGALTYAGNSRCALRLPGEQHPRVLGLQGTACGCSGHGCQPRLHQRRAGEGGSSRIAEFGLRITPNPFTSVF